jgi:hypothetical protein
MVTCGVGTLLNGPKFIQPIFDHAYPDSVAGTPHVVLFTETWKFEDPQLALFAQLRFIQPIEAPHIYPVRDVSVTVTFALGVEVNFPALICIPAFGPATSFANL